MKLDRNTNGDGIGKYALLNMRRVQAAFENFDAVGTLGGMAMLMSAAGEIEAAIQTLEKAGVIDWGRIGSDDEFFVMKLKDENAPKGLQGYAASAALTDAELAEDVMALALRAEKHPGRKRPD